MEFVIDRSKWRCGGDREGAQRGKGDTQMLNTCGFMCCLGQISHQLGAPTESLQDEFTARGVCIRNESLREPLSFLAIQRGTGWDDTSLGQAAMEINDSSEGSDAERETQLAALFATYGHAISFTGEYVKP